MAQRGRSRARGSGHRQRVVGWLARSDGDGGGRAGWRRDAEILPRSRESDGLRAAALSANDRLAAAGPMTEGVKVKLMMPFAPTATGALAPHSPGASPVVLRCSAQHVILEVP